MAVPPANATQVLSVSELTRMVKGTLEAAFPPLWVEGELSGVKQAASGHLYFTLKDDKSQIRAVAFARSAARLPFRPEDGMQVLVFARLTVYEPRGDYQLIVEELEPKGAGALRIALEQLKERLRAEGLFDERRKKPLPEFPSRVGVVTSPTGAAIHDILEVFRNRRSPVRVILAPALVQGEGAPESLVEALGLLVEHGEAELVIVGRGGGSFEDLLAFSDERVVRAVAACPLPTVSAVGHETDFVLTDLAADRRAPTPSAAAEMVARSGEEIELSLAHLEGRLASAAAWAVDSARARLESLLPRLVHPRARLESARLRLEGLSRRLTAGTGAFLLERRNRWARAGSVLGSLSPLAVLERGYAILAKENGRAVRDPAETRPGELLDARVAKGVVKVRVE